LGVRRDVSSLVDAIKAAAAEGGHLEPTVTVLLMDLEVRESITAAAEQLERDWGRLDIIISNAGFLPPFTPLLEGNEADYWYAWEINIRGTYWIAKAFLPLLLRCRGDKTFVAISSLGAHIVTPGASSYQTSKFAICRFVEFLMQDYGDQVSLICICWAHFASESEAEKSRALTHCLGATGLLDASSIHAYRTC
jgi:NADP-dependent 3-hydroxy acid dehydrogenase YdfG